MTVALPLIRKTSVRVTADLAGSEEIQSVHLAKAPQYRPKLMMN